MTLVEVLKSIVDIAEGAAINTPARGDDLIVALVKVLLEKKLPGFAMAACSADCIDCQALVASLPPEQQAQFEQVLAACDNCGDDSCEEGEVCDAESAPAQDEASPPSES